MSDRLRIWLREELKVRQLPQRELAKKSGISQTRISQTLSGAIPVSAEFCIKVAPVLEVSPEYLLRLAEMLPSESADSENATTQEIIELLKNLTPGQQQEALNFIKFLNQRRTS
jgi:transcriptional regulator with XRE-family HTH domain